jgi:hypothetical protein
MALPYTDQQIEDGITALMDRGQNKASALRTVLNMMLANMSSLVIPAGANFLFGSGVPSSAKGVDGDVYDNILTGDRYGKDAGVWTFQYRAKGADGTTPRKGVDYQDGYTPRKGVDYRDGLDGKDNYQLWLQAGNVGTVATFLDWLRGNLQQGVDGVDGTITHVENYDPASTDGNDGDVWNTAVSLTTERRYKKVSGQWRKFYDNTGTTVVVTPPNTAPSVLVAVAGTATAPKFTAQAADADGVQSIFVKVYSDAAATQLVNTFGPSAPGDTAYITTWSSAPAGSYYAFAVATDTKGLSATSTPGVAFTVQSGVVTPAPGTPITAPPYSKLQVEGSAYDKLFAQSTSIIQGAKDTATDGSAYIGPDGNRYYNNGYVNDGSMAIAARPDLFDESFLLTFTNYFRTRIATTGQFAYICPEYISANGTVGMSAQGGVRPSLDRNPYYINLEWELFNRQSTANRASRYAQLKDFWKFLLVDGMSLINGIPAIASLPFDTAGATPFAQVGFNDSEFVSGAAIHLLSLYFRALNQMAAIALAAGDNAAAADYMSRAAVVQNYANTNLWDSVYGLYRASDGNANAQRDVWGSCAAVFYGLATTAIATKVSQTLVAKKALWYYKGGAACIIEDTHDRPGIACWPAYIKGGAAGLGLTGQAQVTADPTLSIGIHNQFGEYQNFGFWTTYMHTVLTTVAITDSALAKQMFSELSDQMLATNGAETFSKSGFKQVEKYTASMGPLQWVTRGAVVTPTTPSPTGNLQADYRVAFALRGIYPIAEYNGAILTLTKSSNMTDKVNVGMVAGTRNYDLATHNNLVAAGYDLICQVWDQTGNGRHAIQTVRTKCPSSTFHFDGTHYGIRLMQGQFFVYSGTFTGAEARSVFVVYRNMASGTFTTQIFGQAGSKTSGHFAAIQSRTDTVVGHPYFAGYSQDLTDSKVPDTNILLVGFLFNGVNGYLRRNGKQIAAGPLSLSSEGVGYIGNPDAVDVSDGVFYEAIECVTVDNAQTTQIENDEIANYGITDNAVTAALLFQELDSSISYVGTWDTYNISYALGAGNQFRYTAINGDYFQYVIPAGYTRLDLRGLMNTDGATADVYKNGVQAGGFTQVSSTGTNGLYFSLTGLVAGDIIKVVKTGGNDLFVDQFELFY